MFTTYIIYLQYIIIIVYIVYIDFRSQNSQNKMGKLLKFRNEQKLITKSMQFYKAKQKREYHYFVVIIAFNPIKDYKNVKKVSFTDIVHLSRWWHLLSLYSRCCRCSPQNICMSQSLLSR